MELYLHPFLPSWRAQGLRYPLPSSTYRNKIINNYAEVNIIPYYHSQPCNYGTGLFPKQFLFAINICRPIWLQGSFLPQELSTWQITGNECRRVTIKVCLIAKNAFVKFMWGSKVTHCQYIFFILVQLTTFKSIDNGDVPVRVNTCITLCSSALPIRHAV